MEQHGTTWNICAGSRTSSQEYFAHKHLLQLTEGQYTNDLIMRRSTDPARVYTQAPVTIN